MLRGSKIISSAGIKTDISHLACINPQGRLVVILISRSKDEKEVKVVCHDRQIEFKMPAKSVATIVW
jgi:O-glycosyl hydrolase